MGSSAWQRRLEPLAREQGASTCHKTAQSGTSHSRLDEVKCWPADAPAGSALRSRYASTRRSGHASRWWCALPGQGVKHGARAGRSGGGGGAVAALGERGAVRRVRADAMEKILSDVERFRRAHVRQQHDAAPGTRARRRQSVVRRAHDRDAAPACRRDGNLSYDGFIISVPSPLRRRQPRPRPR